MGLLRRIVIMAINKVKYVTPLISVQSLDAEGWFMIVDSPGGEGEAGFIEYGDEYEI